MLCTHICPRMYAYSAGHIQLNLINATNCIQPSATTCIQPSATTYIQPSTTTYIQPGVTTYIQPSATMYLQPSEMMEFNAQTMVFLQRHLVLSILNGRQHHLDPVTINSDFEQIHRERQQRRHTPLLLMMSTRARKTTKVI